MPEGFDEDEGHRLLIRHVSEAARKVVCASILHYLNSLIQHLFLSVRIGAPTTVNPPFSAMWTSPLYTGVIFMAVGACLFGGSATILAGSTTMLKSSIHSSRRRKAKALTVLAVTPIYPKDTSSLYAK